MIKLFKIYIITIIISAICWWATIQDIKDALIKNESNRLNLQRKLQVEHMSKRTAWVAIFVLCIIPIFNIIFSIFLLFNNKEVLKNVENRISK